MVTVPPSESTMGGNDADEHFGSEVGIEELMSVAPEETGESEIQDIFDDLDTLNCKQKLVLKLVTSWLH